MIKEKGRRKGKGKSKVGEKEERMRGKRGNRTYLKGETQRGET